MKLHNGWHPVDARASGIYLVEDTATGLVKLGATEDIKARMAELQRGKPAPLQLIGFIRLPTREDERLLCRLLHKQASMPCLHGTGAWYRRDSDTVKAMIACIETCKHPKLDGLWRITNIVGLKWVVWHPGLCTVYSP